MRHWTSRRLLILATLSLALACLMMIYYGITIAHENSFGERYVTSEIPLIFPFFVMMSFKPITLIVYLLFVSAVLFLEGIKDRLKRVNKTPTRIVLLFVAFASSYEVLWNFYAWFTIWQRDDGVLDMIANTTHDYPILPINFNFATKIIFLIFALSLYGSLFLNKLERTKRMAG